MQNFTYKNPTNLVFGRDTVNELKNLIPADTKNVLLIYGGGSIKRNGLYDRVIEQMQQRELTYHELSGVEPNPRISTVRKGIDLCRENEIDFLLAIGGGSVIDCTKAIAAGVMYDGDPWDLVIKKAKVEAAMPFGTILTLAATGSEMNSGSVITNWETQEKHGWGSPYTYPQFSILDPVNTFTVPRDQTIYGIVDMMSHVLETYFNHTDNTPLQDRMCESVLKTVKETAPKLLNDLENYQYRETILYCGTVALNGTLSVGIRGDWATHNIEHAVSAVYDIPHAGGLAVIFPNWMKHCMHADLDKLVRLGIEVFDVDPAGKSKEEIAKDCIRNIRDFWTGIGAPSRLADYDIDDSQLELIADKAMANGEFGHFKKLNKEDVLSILRASL